ncbi:MAG: hypothetical protein ABSA67_06695 [Candidatus Brocadiia bacterium]|jgi:septal ring factor EnvC (AmiA/AmiB activator)
MKCLQWAAAAAFAAALMMTVGCGPEPTAGTTGGDGVKVAELQKQLDQTKQDLKTAQDDLAAKTSELAAKTTENQTLQKQLAAANAKIAGMTKTVQEAMKLAAPPAAPAPQ